MTTLDMPEPPAAAQNLSRRTFSQLPGWRHGDCNPDTEPLPDPSVNCQETLALQHLNILKAELNTVN